MLPLLATALVAVALASPPATPDEVKIPGGRFESKKAASGRAFKARGWSVTGGAHWIERESGGFALALSRGSSLERALEVSALKPLSGAKGDPDVAGWLAILSVDVAVKRSSRGRGRKTGLRLTLARPGGGKRYGARQAIERTDFGERVRIVLPAAELLPGRWVVKLAPVGPATVLVDDLRLHRVPVDPAEMRFAKPNGKNGPDRLESGALGFVAWTAHEHSPLPVKEVRSQSPAAAAGLRPGDVVVAVDGRALPRSSCKPGQAWFERGHEAMLGRAVEAAMATQEPRVQLEVLRDRKPRTIALAPEPRPSLPEDFPFDDAVTPKLYDDVIEFVRRTRKKRGFWKNGGNEWIQTSFAGLALLGRRDPQDAETIRETADWFLRRFPEPETFGNLGYWAASYSGIFMCEYLMASGDGRVKPWIRAAQRWIAAGFHTSKWGMPALGHGPSGLPYGQKALMAPASHVLVFDALAHEAGLDSGLWEKLWPYVEHSWSDPKKGGHGAMGYNASFRDQGEFWSRTGLTAMACRLRGQGTHMIEPMVAIMGRRHAWMRNSHAYGNPGDTWGLTGLAHCDRDAFASVMRAWRWSLGGAWQPGYGLRHTTAHMGSPYMGGEGLVNPAFAMLLSVRHRGLVMTGARDVDRQWLRLPSRPTPKSPVRIEWTPEGLVCLRAIVPGNAIVYTTDGRDPDGEATLYTGPFALDSGGRVAARIRRSDGSLGKVTRRAMGLPKSGWRIIAADGAAEADTARDRARALIDGEPSRPWQPDRGQGSQSLPLAVTIDLGERQAFAGLCFRGAHLPREVAVSWGDTAGSVREAGRRFETVGKKEARIRFERLVEARYVRLEIVSLRQGKKLRFGELDLLWPEPRVVGQGKAATLRAPEGLRLGAARNPAGPWKPVRRLAPGKPGALYRVLDRRGRPIGPVRVAEPR